MDLDQIKLILRNMELLLDTLKAEVYNAESKPSAKESSPPPIMDYDEIFEDSEFYDQSTETSKVA